MPSKSKKAAQLVRYFFTVYYYAGEDKKGMVGRHYCKNIFGKRPGNDWLRKVITGEIEKTEKVVSLTLISSVELTKTEYEYQQLPPEKQAGLP